MTDLNAEQLDLISHPIFVLEPDPDGVPRYVAFNAHARGILKRPLEAILGLTAAELYPGPLGEVAFAHHCAALRTGQARVYELLLPVNDGQRPVRTTLRPVLDGAGRTVRIFGSTETIAEPKLFEDLRKGADRIAQDMEDFIHLAAHDLRSPMRHVSMIADLLREDFHDMGDGKLELIDLLENTGTKAMNLIDDVLTYAQSGSVAQTSIAFDLSELVGEILQALDPMRRCRMDCAVVHLQADQTAMQIILRNLIDNALKHAKTEEEGGPRLSISAAAHMPGFVSVTVSDNGTSFDDPALMFLNGGALRCDSGFGLLGVRRIIHARGGTLSVTQTADNGGAEIAFTLPGALLGADLPARAASG